MLKPPWLLSGFGTAGILLALLFPGPALHPSISAWLPLHWALGIASYGLFGVAVAHAWLMTRAETRIRSATEASTGLPLLTMERLIFRFVSVGFVLLSATLLAGFFFDTQLYGSAHAIKWDHKTVFSVLSWLTFAVLVVGRSRFGWRGRRAIRILYTGSGLLLLAYVGSRFVLEVVLGRTL
ncbi:inner membrane protein YpjD [mine drainage metagenome]|uniref:Inner membrane protein YpjD n=1 Tax=mine drainage metagenome TaxID=410659 RepID=A0A1J5PFR3_9ZZZZ